MAVEVIEGFEKSRLAALLEHLGGIEDPREPWRVAHPLREVLLLVVCATIADCDDYDAIADWGAAHLDFLRQHLPYTHGIPGGRWLTILMNRINPALFSAAFTAWVRETWPDRPDFVAIDGKTSRRSHDRAAGEAPLHLVSAFATTSRLVLGQEAVPDKANELTAIPALLARLGEQNGLRGALVSIDAIATNAAIATAINAAGADYLLAVKANQPTLRAEVEACFNDAPPQAIASHVTHDKGHGRIERREVSVIREVDWLSSDRRFPGELRLPSVACLIKVLANIERAGQARDALLHLLRCPRRRARRPCRAWALGDREPSALGPRRHIQGGPVPPAQGLRRKQHGRRAAFRLEPRANRKGQAIRQVQAKARRLGHRLSRRPTRKPQPLTRISSPDTWGEPGSTEPAAARRWGGVAAAPRPPGPLEVEVQLGHHLVVAVAEPGRFEGRDGRIDAAEIAGTAEVEVAVLGADAERARQPNSAPPPTVQPVSTPRSRQPLANGPKLPAGLAAAAAAVGVGA